jgi:hypothetical protein
MKMTSYELKSKENIIQHYSIHNKFLTNPPHKLTWWNNIFVAHIDLKAYQI